MHIGIGSWTFPWSIGVAGYPTPPTPLDARGLLKLAGELQVHTLQICDNYPLHTLSANELATIHSTAQAMGIRVEVGTRGVDPAHLLRYLDVAQALGSASVRMAMMFLINFIIGWNEFFTPLIFARGVESKVITMALSEAQVVGSSTQFYQSWGNMSSVAIMATIPVFIITLIFQKQIVEGITSGVFK